MAKLHFLSLMWAEWDDERDGLVFWGLAAGHDRIPFFVARETLEMLKVSSAAPRNDSAVPLESRLIPGLPPPYEERLRHLARQAWAMAGGRRWLEKAAPGDVIALDPSEVSRGASPG